MLRPRTAWRREGDSNLRFPEIIYLPKMVARTDASSAMRDCRFLRPDLAQRLFNSALSPQNFLPAGLSKPQLAQRMDHRAATHRSTTLRGPGQLERSESSPLATTYGKADVWAYIRSPGLRPPC